MFATSVRASSVASFARETTASRDRRKVLDTADARAGRRADGFARCSVVSTARVGQSAADMSVVDNLSVAGLALSDPKRRLRLIAEYPSAAAVSLPLPSASGSQNA
tara:strand:+ start:2195 stop:2512 length:318 start_codon:yes stop_codon:yes gene_type:complete